MQRPPRPQDVTPATILTAGRALTFLLRWAPLALLVAFALAAFAFDQARRTAPTYEATIALDVGRTARPPAGVDVIPPPQVTAYAYRTALWEGGLIARGFETALDATLDPAARERYERTVRVAIEEHSISSILRVTVRHGDATTAANVANAIGSQLVMWDATRARRAIDQARDALTRTLDDLDAQLRALPGDAPTRDALTTQRDALNEERLASASLAAVPAIDWLATAIPPNEPIAPRPFFTTFVAFTLGLIGSYLAVYVGLLLDRRAGNAAATQALTGLPILAHVTRRPTPATRQQESGLLAARVTALTHPATPEGRPVTLLVTAPRNARSSTRVTTTLAEGATRQGARVLLLDATPPGRRAGGDASVTPDNYTHQRVPWRDTLLPALRDALAHHQAAAGDAYDLILIDAPPLLTHADTLAIARHATHVLLASDPARTRRADLLRSLDLLTEQHAHTIGLTLSRRGPWRPFAPREASRAARRTAMA